MQLVWLLTLTLTLPMNPKLRSLISNGLRSCGSWPVSRSQRNKGLSMNRECLSSLGEEESHEKECSQPIAPWLDDHDGAPVSKPALRERSWQNIPLVCGRPKPVGKSALRSNSAPQALPGTRAPPLPSPLPHKWRRGGPKMASISDPAPGTGIGSWSHCASNAGGQGSP